MTTMLKQKTQKQGTASALASAPRSLARSSSFDIILEEKLKDAWEILPFLTGYQKPQQHTVLKALHGDIGTKVGTVLGGSKATGIVLAARAAGGDVSLRLARPDIEVGRIVPPDPRGAHLVMQAADRFSEEDAWLIHELTGCEEKPEEMTRRIHESAHGWRVVNVVTDVPFPIVAAVADLLRIRGFNGLMIRKGDGWPITEEAVG